MGHWNPFVSFLNPTENRPQSRFKGPREPKIPKVPYSNASHAGKRRNPVIEERIPTPQMGENRA